MIVYISIGNSDDKLTQARWAEFVADASRAVQQTGTYPGGAVHGEWRSLPDAPWQNACWCLQLPGDPLAVEALKTFLGQLAHRYEQESIAWAEAPVTEFIRLPPPIVHVSPGCACGVNAAGQPYVDPICRTDG